MKKGFTWLEWTLALGVTVAITTMVILWGTRTTRTLTEETVSYISGRSDCQEIKLSAVMDCGALQMQVTNRGHLKIRKLILTFDDNTQMDTEKEGYPELSLQGTGDETIILNIPQPFSNVTVLPVLDVNDKLYGCQDKSLKESC